MMRLSDGQTSARTGSYATHALAVAAAVLATAACVTPWSFTTGTAAKSVLIPNTALNASACPPVFAVTVSAAAFALAHVAFAVASAPQLFTS